MVPAPDTDPGSQIRLAPGERLHFGRTAPRTAAPPTTGARTAGARTVGALTVGARRHLDIPHPGVSRTAGERA
ncbi:hypothetical protein [Streptomyces sp. NPDC052494]|uniref:hypothetical protein n=1 Tax=Streptomyces sp. NPDC052494 TaxID=3365692 RepID=UPI0037D7906C